MIYMCYIPCIVCPCIVARLLEKGGFQHWMDATTGPVSSHIVVCNMHAWHGMCLIAGHTFIYSISQQ
jgi:hypothetical protein